MSGKWRADQGRSLHREGEGREPCLQELPECLGRTCAHAVGIEGLETVWIHAGDIVGGYCSHGCINLPIFPAMKLFEWASRMSWSSSWSGAAWKGGSGPVLERWA